MDTNKPFSKSLPQSSGGVGQVKDIDFPPEGPGGSEDHNFDGDSDDENIADMDIDEAAAPADIDILDTNQSDLEKNKNEINAEFGSKKDASLPPNLQNSGQILKKNLLNQNLDDQENQQVQADFSNFQRVADLTWEQKLIEKQKFWDVKWHEYEVGEYVDGVDSVQKWCLAQIVQKDEFTAKIHFDGWSSKWDVTYKWNSYRLAPFRRYSSGYSGQQRTPLRQNMIFNQNQLIELTYKVINLTKNKFNGLTAKQVTQFLRGTLFVQTDFLLSGYHQYSEEDLIKINIYFKAVIKLICVWLKEIPALIQKVTPDIRKDSDIFLVDEDVATFQAYPELLGLLHRFFLGCHRCLRYFIFFDREVEEFKKAAVTVFTNNISFVQQSLRFDQEYDIDLFKERVQERDKNFIFGQAINFLNFFSECEGFDLIIQLLKSGNIKPTSQAKSQNEKEDNYELMSIDFLSQILTIFSNCGQLLQPQFSQKFVQTVQEIVNTRFNNIKDKDIKELSKDDLPKFLKCYNQFLQIAKSPLDVSQIIEQMQLMLAVRFLNTSYLEKKLQGINDLRHMIERVQTRQLIEKQAQKFMNSDQVRPTINFLQNQNGQKIYPTQFIDVIFLKEWIIKEKIAENLFGEGSHPELFKRSVPIIKFLCKYNGITQEVVDLIWKSQLGKHEETVRVIYNTIIELVIDLPIYLLNYLFSKILEVPQNLYNEMYLQFLKDFTLQALDSKERLEYFMYNRNKLKNQDSQQDQIIQEDDVEKESNIFNDLKSALENPEKAAQIQDGELFGLPIFWNLIQDNFENNFELQNAEILDISLKAIHEILSRQSATKLRNFYLLKSLSNLRNGVTLYPTISIFITIIQNFDNQLFSQRDNQNSKALISSSKSIIQIEKQLGLINTIITDILKYYNQVKEHLKSLTLKNKVPVDKIENFIFAGRSSHQSTLDKLFEILEYIVLTSDWAVSINNQNIELLWKTFVLQPNFQIEQTLFLQFVNKRRLKKIQKENEIYISSRQKQEVNIFTPKEQHYLFTQILCNSTFVDYQKITLGEAKCFHTYFQLINKEEENLSIYQNKIELINYKKLQGLESLWRITFDSENEKATEQSGELLIDLHLRVSNNYNSEGKKNIIIHFIEKCMQQLLEISQFKQKKTDDSKNISQEQILKDEQIDKKILKVVQMLSEFLNRYEGKKQIKAQMKQMQFQYQNIQPFNITVIYNQGQGIPSLEGRIQVSQFETLGAIRERCANLFGLEINEFHLKFKNGLVDPDEDDDKYVKEHGISAQIWMIQNSTYNKLNHPKYIISQNQEYFDLLFSLLTNSGALLIEPLWELLQKLPVNLKLHEDIKNLQGAQQNWDSLLDSASTHKLLYSLKIIQTLDEKSISDSKALQSFKKENIDNEQEGSRLYQWKQKFIELGGFIHLLKIFKGAQIQKIDSKLTLMWIETMLNVLIDFLQINNGLQEIILQNQKDIIFKSLQYIYQIGLFTLSIESQRGEPFEEVQAKRQQLKLAKLKMRSQQSLNQGKKNQQANDDANSDGEDDEVNKKVNNIIKEFQSIKNIIEIIFNFMNKYIFMQDKLALSFFDQYEDLHGLIKVLMVQSENWSMRLESGRQLKQIIVSCKDEPQLQRTIVSSIKILLFEILPLTQQHERRCGQFFDLVKRILEELSSDDLKPLNEEISQIIKKIATDIEKRETKESNTKSEDKILVGQMTILKALLQKYPKLKKLIGTKLVPHLLSDCLFQVSHQSSAGIAIKPKCKSILSRTSALQLLSTLSRDCLENLEVLLDYLKNFDQQQSWRSNKQSDWQITHLDDEKSTTGYVGLKNLGCICYMISLFQQLFMVPGFCQDILSCQDPNHNNSEPDENMFYQFQTIFAGLLKSEKQYVNPKGFCHSFKDWEGQPTNVLEQMDVEEFLQMFFDRLETAIKGTKQQKTIQYHFGGKFASEMICKGCPHYYERSEPFLSIGIQVKNKRSIQEGLNAFIQGDMLEGDNAYLCAKCDKKVDTLKRTCVKELPRYLIVTLKRFEFDFDRMMRVKVNDYCEFPMELDMLPYTQEGLQRKEKAAKSKQEANDNGVEFVEEELIHPKEYYEFKLKGIVVHSGTADSGHYYSFIKDYKSENGEKWYEFNDNIVRDFDLADLSNECFGGDETFQGIGQSNFKSQKWGNAYLVIYERKNQNEMKHFDDENQLNENNEIKEEAKQEIQENQISVIDAQHPIQQKIALENQKYWQNKFLFGQEYFDFVSEITHYWDTANIIPLNSLNKNNDYHITGQKVRVKQDLNLKSDIVQPLDEIYDLRSQYDPSVIQESAHNVFKFTARFYLTILQRAQNKTLVPRFVDAIKAYLNYDTKNGKWLIKQYSNWIIIEELFLQLSGLEMPKIGVGIIYCAMISIYEEEKNKLNLHWTQVDVNQQQETKEESVLGNFILILISNLYKIHNFNLNIPHYFQILARFASLGPEAREFLLRSRIVGRCMDYFFDKASPYRDDFSNMQDLGRIFVNKLPEIGLPNQIDIKMSTFFQLLQEQRRCKFIAQATPKYKYMFELISYCVLHLNVGGHYQALFQIDHGISKLETFIDPKESDIFVPEAGFLKKVIQECKRSRSMWNIAKAHVHYASFEKDQTQELFKTVFIGLKEFDYDGLKPFLILFEVLIQTDNQNAVFSKNEQLVKFMDVIKSNLIYYKWMEVVIEFIFKIICKYPSIKEWFYKQQVEWKFLVDWMTQNQRAPHPAQMQQNIQLFKPDQGNSQIQQLQYGDMNEAVKNTISARYRMHRLQQLLQSNLPDLSQEIDLDRSDLQDYKFMVGELVVLYDRKREEISRWRVVKVLDEMINIACVDNDSMNKNKLLWQKCDTDKLKLESHYRTNQRIRLRSDLREQLIAQRQEAIRQSQRQNQLNAEQEQSHEPRNQQQAKNKQVSAGGDTEGASSHEAGSEAYGSSEEDNQDLYTNN